MTSTRHKLESLTDYLSKRQDDILLEWERRMMQTESKSTELATMSRNEFRNHIPTFLEEINESLIDRQISLEKTGRKHGADRWEYGLDLQEMVKEWNILHQVLMDELNRAQEVLHLSFDTYKKAQKSLSVHIDEGVLFSVKEFDELRRFETEAQMLDLREVLREPDKEKLKDTKGSAESEPDGLERDENLRSTSHDLKGIMKSLQMGFFLLEDEELGENSTELIDQMSLAADSLEQLLNDLLDLFRLETHKETLNITEINTAHVLRELCESIQPMARTESLELECTGDDSLPVKTDSKKIQRVVRNLVLNALKYTHEGYVKVHWEALSKDQWLLEISDTGPGLSVTHAKTLTTEVEYSDTIGVGDEHPPGPPGLPAEVENHGEGIGLLIVRHLCKLLDGLIKVKTGPLSGTTFTITFPRQLSK